MTASVQGHNINVFKIMPGYETVSASDAAPSYVHLYRLQRGLTNAVSSSSCPVFLWNNTCSFFIFKMHQ